MQKITMHCRYIHTCSVLMIPQTDALASHEETGEEAGITARDKEDGNDTSAPPWTAT